MFWLWLEATLGTTALILYEKSIDTITISFYYLIRTGVLIILERRREMSFLDNRTCRSHSTTTGRDS
jgi:hypothetical protein